MPALTIPDTGLGTTLTASGIAPTLIKRIGPVNISVDALETTHLGTTGMKTMRPSDLRNNPEVEIEFYWTGASVPITTAMIPTVEPYAGVTATIAYPGAGSLAGTVFVKSVEFPSVEQGQIMMGKMVLQYDGVTLPTFTAA
jgi:hypothetical protein